MNFGMSSLALRSTQSEGLSAPRPRGYFCKVMTGGEMQGCKYFNQSLPSPYSLILAIITLDNQLIFRRSICNMKSLFLHAKFALCHPLTDAYIKSLSALKLGEFGQQQELLYPTTSATEIGTILLLSSALGISAGASLVRHWRTRSPQP
jgi:hypothetical protein